MLTITASVFESIEPALESGDVDAVLAPLGDAVIELKAGAYSDIFQGDARREAVLWLFAAFAALAVTPVSRATKGLYVVQDTVVSGSHVGPVGALLPTARRVRVNVRMVATYEPSGQLERLRIEPDVRALSAQLGDSKDVMGMAAGLIATVKENQAAPVLLVDENPVEPAASPAIPAPRKGRTPGRRVVAGAVAALVLLATGAVAAWQLAPGVLGFDARATASPVDVATPTSSPTATPSQTTSPATAASTALPVIETAQPTATPKVQAGRQVVLASDVLFAVSSSQLTAAAESSLVTLARQIRQANVQGTIQVNGYTDNVGAAAKNVTLATDRALAVARVLQRELSGVPVKLEPQGFGQANPVASNATTDGQAQNRRVTIVLPTA